MLISCQNDQSSNSTIANVVSAERFDSAQCSKLNPKTLRLGVDFGSFDIECSKDTFGNETVFALIILNYPDCIKQNPIVDFVLTDGTILHFAGSSDIACDGFVSIKCSNKFRNSKNGDNLLKLLASKVTEIRIPEKEKINVIAIPEKPSSDFYVYLNCKYSS